MFDFSSSKLLILGIVALLVIGPKELPSLLRTLGRYMGIIRKHANEFRAQFDEAMRESELAELKKEVEKVGQEAESTIRSAEETVQGEIDAAKAGVDASMEDPAAKFEADAGAVPEALPAANAGGAAGTTAPLNGAGHPDGEAAAETADAPGQAAGKSGA